MITSDQVKYVTGDWQTLAYFNGVKVGAVWGPSVEGYWFCGRIDDKDALRLATREDAETYLRKPIATSHEDEAELG